jgi:nucleic acid/nucleotide deaminase of polymorphic system toxin
MRTLFNNTTVEVVPVTNLERPNPLVMSTSLPEWETLFENVLDSQNARRTFKPFRVSVPSVPKTTHCECALVAFLHNNKEHSPTFSYIGVSKLSCKPCHNWIQAYNEQPNRPSYYTKGCHDKWYPGWKSPSLIQTKAQRRVDERFVERTQNDLCDYLVDQGFAVARASSDREYENIPDCSMADIEADLYRFLSSHQ